MLCSLCAFKYLLELVGVINAAVAIKQQVSFTNQTVNAMYILCLTFYENELS